MAKAIGTTFLSTRGTKRTIGDFINPAYKRGIAKYIEDVEAMGRPVEGIEGSTLLFVNGDRISELPKAYCY